MNNEVNNYASYFICVCYCDCRSPLLQAYEVDASGSAASDQDSSTEAMITVTIRDVNDEPPTFNRREYRTSVPENVADGTPLGGLDIVVRDTDVVSISNSTFYDQT